MNSGMQRLLLRIALGTCLAFLAVLPLIPLNPEDSFHDLGRFAQGPLFLLIWPYVAFGVWGGGSLHAKPNFGGIHLALLLAAAISSCMHAAVPGMALRELMLAGNLGVVALAVSRMTAGEIGKTWAVRGVIIAPAVYCASLLTVVAIALVTGLHLDSSDLIFGYDNIRFLNHTQTVTLPLLAGILGIEALGSRWRAVAWFALVVSFSLLVLTRGRATMVGLLAIAALAALVFDSSGRRIAVRLLVGAVMGTVVYALVFRFLAELMTGAVIDPMALGEVDSVRARLFLWHRALEMIANSPWLGVGPMHFAHVTDGIAGTVMYDNAAHPHNIYLQIAAEYGLPAACLIFGGAFFALFKRGAALRRCGVQGGYQPLTLAAFLACIGAAVDGLFSGNFVMPISQIWIALAAGLLYADVRPSVAPSAGVGSRAWGGLLIAGLLASQLWLMTVMSTEWWEGHKAWNGHDSVKAAGAQEQPEGLRRSRFWLNGWF